MSDPQELPSEGVSAVDVHGLREACPVRGVPRERRYVEAVAITGPTDGDGGSAPGSLAP